jgi:hypothetical protein
MEHLSEFANFCLCINAASETTRIHALVFWVNRVPGTGT